MYSSEKKRIRDEQKRKRRSESDISKRQQSVIKTAPPKSIPPFELPQVTHHTSGLNGPIYKREELLKKSQEAELFNQAYRATMAQTVSSIRRLKMHEIEEIKVVEHRR